jgi:NhaP-type Na+/H+ or K+/H+ antiporter
MGIILAPLGMGIILTPLGMGIILTPARGALAQRPPRRSGSPWRGESAVPIGWANSKGAESLSISLAAYGSLFQRFSISAAFLISFRAFPGLIG